jgi:hypothetical protein
MSAFISKISGAVSNQGLFSLEQHSEVHFLKFKPKLYRGVLNYGEIYQIGLIC